MLNIIEPGKRPILRSDFFILFAFCRSAEGGDEFLFLLSSSKDSTNRSNDVGNLSIFAGHFAEKELLIKEMKQAIKAFNFHLSKGYKKKKHDIWENWSMTSLIVPVLLVLAQTMFISPHFTGFLPENRQRERPIRVLNGRFLFSDDWLLHASLHSGWSTHTIGNILWQVARFSESSTQDIKYKELSKRYQDAMDPDMRSKYDHFSIATVQHSCT